MQVLPEERSEKAVLVVSLLWPGVGVVGEHAVELTRCEEPGQVIRMMVNHPEALKPLLECLLGGEEDTLEADLKADEARAGVPLSYLPKEEAVAWSDLQQEWSVRGEAE